MPQRLAALRYFVVSASVLALIACGGATGPDTESDGNPDFRGVIVFITEDGRFRVDDGSATACGFVHVRVPDAAEIRWSVGGRATYAALDIGRRVSLWMPDEQRNGFAPRCETIDAR
jgi:hypothetical protein